MKQWIKAARPRTLILGLAAPSFVFFTINSHPEFNALSFTFFTLCFILLQLVSNLANDLGDGLKGSDINKVGEQRTFGKKGFGKKEFVKAIIVVSVLAFVFGVLSLVVSAVNWQTKATIFGLGIAAIIAALTYTLGKKSYGYVGLGDLSVMIFFGFLPVYVPHILSTNEIAENLWQMAVAIGCMSVAVLNVNNLRDYPEDKKNGKKTMVVRLGFKGGKVYHSLLLATAFVLVQLYVKPSADDISIFIYAPLSFLSLLLAWVWQQKDLEKLDNSIKFHALTCLLIALSVGLIGYV